MIEIEKYIDNNKTRKIITQLRRKIKPSQSDGNKCSICLNQYEHEEQIYELNC